MAQRRLIERYILRTIFPYGVAALLLLTAILFVQQTGRYFETIFHGVMPAEFVYGLSLALLPTVLVFTIPMAVLCGTIIGLGRMSSDSELVAMSAAGVSTWRTLWPALAVGVLATLATSYLNLQEVPRSQRQLRSVALRSALYKLDSPVEPRTLTTDFPGKVIYVRDGNKTSGEWGRVFIQTQEADQSTNLITARAGRIDSSADQSELVLQDAMKSTVPAANANVQSYIIDLLYLLRVAFNTGRKSILYKLERPEPNADEMNFRDLRAYVAQSTGVEHREASMVLHKRLSLSLTPFVFSLFGSALALRMRRGGRGFGVLVSLAIMLLYYLLTIAGDQAGRAGTVRPVVGAWFSTVLILTIGILILAFRQRQIRLWLRPKSTAPVSIEDVNEEKVFRARHFSPRLWIASFPTLLDLSIVRTMVLSFVVGFVALVLIFDVFTTFELWRFISSNGAGVKLVAEYLFYLDRKSVV